MFNLEQSIANWREQMLAAGIKTPAPLEELEIHLREEIGRQIKLGAQNQPAFEIAVEKIGGAQLLKSEFQKTTPLTPERIVSLGVGIPTVFVGLWIMRLLAVQIQGIMPKEYFQFLGFFILGYIFAAALVVLGLILVFYSGGRVSGLPNARNKLKCI